jgi:S1-C subfamily serine protease
LSTDLEQLASSTVLVRAGECSGSGFFFLRDDIIVTNQHVIEGSTRAQVLQDGSAAELSATVVASSPADEDDFAILRLTASPSLDHHVLHPSEELGTPRGKEVAIAGFPHGISHLLVQKGIVSGPLEDYGFYLDVPVNGGNSGGPVVDMASGELVGIVTASRFLGGDTLDDLEDEAAELEAAASGTAGMGTIQLMGVDFGAFAGMTGRSLGILRQVISANANTGLGIAYRISYALDAARAAGIT